MAGHKFRSRIHAAQQAVKVWVCRNCNEWHYRYKPKVCRVCTSGDLRYFMSHGEAKRYAKLQLLNRRNEISHLEEPQIPFPVYVNGATITAEKLGAPVFTYYADFRYQRNGTTIIEDYKGDAKKSAMDLFELKRKIIEPLYGITITITEG